MQYKDVVKAMFAKHSGKMAPKDIMKMAAAEYRKMKGTGQMPRKRMSRGGGSSGGLLTTGDVMSSLGFGLDEEGKGMKKGRGKRMPRGGGVIGDIASPLVGMADSLGSLFGLGLDEGKGMKKGRGKRMPRGKRGGYMSAGALSAGDIEPQAMTPGDGAFAQVPMNPRVLSDNAMGGNILNSVSRFLPMMALLA